MTADKTAAPTPGAARGWLEILGSRSLRMVLVLLGLWVALGLHPETRAAFLTAGNLSNLTAQVAEIVIIGVGMTLVVLIKGIDLSVGAGMALTGVIAAMLQKYAQQPAIVAVLAAVAVAALIGLWHGMLVTRFEIPPFIATLSGFMAYRGAGLVLSNAEGLSPMGDDFGKLASALPTTLTTAICLAGCAAGLALLVTRERRRRALGLATQGGASLVLSGLAILAATAFCVVIYQRGMPVPVLIAALTVALGAILLGESRLGRYAVAIGGNAEAARLSGVPVARVTIAIYLLTGVLTAVAGMVAAARTNGVTPGNAGAMRELQVISAVVIGGTSLNGGRATMIGTVIGALIFGTLSNGMNLLGWSSDWQLILTGMILLGASLLDSLSTKKITIPLPARVAALAAVALLVVLRARGGAPAAGPASGPKVAFILSSLQEERYQKDKRYFEDEARKLGLSPFTLAADNDNGRQLSQVEDALSRGAKVLVVQPTDSAAAAAYVGKARAAGAKIVAYDRSINGGADFYVAHDSHRVGVLQAEAAVKATGGKGNFVILNGQSGHSVAMEIARGYLDVLRPLIDRGDVKIIVEKSHDSWSPEQALKTMEDAIAKSGGDIAAVLANNSGMARGAVQAVQAGGLAGKKIFIAGADADAANVNYVCEGKQSVEVLKDIKPLADKAAEVAAALAFGRPVLGAAPAAPGQAPTVAVEVHLITADNVKLLLLDSGFHAEKALPACRR
jgi:ABC-type xylose transport system permease subunit/ABC-type xylose transport system substrate-binding protein